MDILSLVAGFIVGLLVALGLITLRPRMQPRASKREFRELERTDTGDPIADADTRMAHGWYEDAANLLLTSLSRDPKRNDVKLKLLEVYFIWDKPVEYAAAAKEFRRELSSASADWDKVVTMGQQICPEEAIFKI